MGKKWEMDGRQLLKFTNVLKDFAGNQYPIINGMALNRTAFETRKQMVKIVERKFTLRNKQTVRSIQFTKVKGLNPATQESVVGSTMNYMASQEFGDTKTSKGKKGIGLPTTGASNESKGSRPRKKVVSKPRRRSSIRFTKSTVKSKSRKHHVFLTIRAASKKGSGTFVYLPIQNAKGIYRVTGKGKKAKIRMMYSLSERSLKIKKQPSLLTAVNKIAPKMPGFYIHAAQKRMKKSFKL